MNNFATYSRSPTLDRPWPGFRGTDTTRPDGTVLPRRQGISSRSIIPAGAGKPLKVYSHVAPTVETGLVATEEEIISERQKFLVGTAAMRAAPVDDEPDTSSERARQAQAEQVAHERMVLLARKFSNRGTTETLARLEKLNKVLEDLLPRITDKHVAALEDTQALLARGAAAREERVARRAARRQAHVPEE